MSRRAEQPEKSKYEEEVARLSVYSMSTFIHTCKSLAYVPLTSMRCVMRIYFGLL